MANFFKKAMTFVGLAEEDENLEEQEELNPIKEVNTDYTPSSSSGKKGKMVTERRQLLFCERLHDTGS